MKAARVADRRTYNPNYVQPYANWLFKICKTISGSLRIVSQCGFVVAGGEDRNGEGYFRASRLWGRVCVCSSVFGDGKHNFAFNSSTEAIMTTTVWSGQFASQRYVQKIICGTVMLSVMLYQNVRISRWRVGLSFKSCCNVESNAVVSTFMYTHTYEHAHHTSALTYPYIHVSMRRVPVCL